MSQAAIRLVGVHDFAAFGTPLRLGGATVRNVIRAGWLAHKDERTFEITANAFLYRMVRRLVSFMTDVGQGSVPVETVSTCLERGAKTLVKGLAPPQGLTLVEVGYTNPMSLATGWDMMDDTVTVAAAMSQDGEEERGKDLYTKR
jgi:tRNA pseudouridine38-40 synthase